MYMHWNKDSKETKFYECYPLEDIFQILCLSRLPLSASVYIRWAKPQVEQEPATTSATCSTSLEAPCMQGKLLLRASLILERHETNLRSSSRFWNFSRIWHRTLRPEAHFTALVSLGEKRLTHSGRQSLLQFNSPSLCCSSLHEA